MASLTIYVALVGEDVEAWRPVLAKPLGDNTFEILDQPYDRDVEQWSFEPGERVICSDAKLEGERFAVAIANAS